ncbi:hypothetical protein PFISCL1PPCAC_13513, partial [Pristionchus fissidentatus]
RWILLAIAFVSIFISCFECLRYSTVKILNRIRPEDECNLMISTVDGYLNPNVDACGPSDKKTQADKRRLMMQNKKYESMHVAVENDILHEVVVPLCTTIPEESQPPASPPNWHLRQMTRV